MGLVAAQNKVLPRDCVCEKLACTFTGTMPRYCGVIGVEASPERWGRGLARKMGSRPRPKDGVEASLQHPQTTTTPTPTHHHTHTLNSRLLRSCESPPPHAADHAMLARTALCLWDLMLANVRMELCGMVWYFRSNGWIE